MNFDELPRFQKELKRLNKKYNSLHGDLQSLKDLIPSLPLVSGKFLQIITQTEDLYIVKYRLLCEYLKKPAFRVIYAHFKHQQRVEFLELYFKGDKENEDHDRIREYLKKYSG